MIATKLVTGHRYVMVSARSDQRDAPFASEMRAERIGYRMKLLRLALGLRPSEIADSLDIERTYWSRFENGRRGLTEELAAQLVDRYSVTLDFLILGRWGGLPVDLAERMREEERKLRDETSIN